MTQTMYAHVNTWKKISKKYGTKKDKKQKTVTNRVDDNSTVLAINLDANSSNTQILRLSELF
jgi:hypothetical protein